MSFHASGQNFRLEGSTLRGSLRNASGQEVDASVDLNTLIGNNDGRFYWGGQGVADSAQNLSLSMESDQQLPILRGQLRNANGNFVDADLNLAERIGNNDGQFVLI